MSPTTVAPAPPEIPQVVRDAGRRFGYVIAMIVNGGMLWAAHRLLDWEWPGFLTDDFADVLPLLSASLVLSVVANAVFVVHDRGRLRALLDLAGAAVGLAVSLRMWDVFPFDFSGYDHDWSWLLRIVVGLGMLGTAISLLANAAKLGWNRSSDR